jgi:hypothetical protein
MAQDFEAVFITGINTGSYSTILTSNSDDAIVGIRFANRHSGSVTVDAKITKDSTDYFLIKEAPIPGGSSLELIDGGSKIVIQSGSLLKANCDRSGSVDLIVSYIDAIST